MGNRRSYSKGCGTCVKRRVKCDQRHPTCVRCEKGRFSCEGFKEVTFVDAKEQVMRRFASESRVGSSSTELAKSNALASSHQPDYAIATTNSATYCWQVPPPKLPPNYLPRSPNTSPFRDEMYVLYTVENLCMRQLAMMYWNCLPCNPSGLPPHQSMMKQCLLAIAKVFYGLRNHDRTVLEDGMRLYGRELRMLNNILGKTNCDVTSEMIISVFLMSMGESIIPSGKSSWMIHILGLEHLFALRGPLMTENITMLDHILLESCRPLMILGAFFTQRPSLMGEPEWKAITVPQNSNEKSVAVSDLSFLMGVLAQLPALFQLCNKCIRLAKTNPAPRARLDIVWGKLKQLQQELEAWKEKWNSFHQREVYEILPVTGVDSTAAMVWQTIFSFSSVEIAKTFTMYHAVNILVTGVHISLLEADLGPPFSTFMPLHCEGVSIGHSLSDVKTSVRNICRSTQYYTQFPKPLQVGADYYLFFPVHVARRTSNQWGFSTELIWLADAFQAMKSKYSMGLWANMDFGSRFSGFQEGLFG